MIALACCSPPTCRSRSCARARSCRPVRSGSARPGFVRAPFPTGHDQCARCRPRMDGCSRNTDARCPRGSAPAVATCRPARIVANFLKVPQPSLCGVIARRHRVLDGIRKVGEDSPFLLETFERRLKGTSAVSSGAGMARDSARIEIDGLLRGRRS